jgi:threonine aldolase
MLAYLEGGLWLELAKSANAHAARLAAELSKVPGVRLPWPAAANEIFAIIPRVLDDRLKAAGAHYYGWTVRAFPAALNPPGEKEAFIRLVTSYATTAEDIDRLIAVARGS